MHTCKTKRCQFGKIYNNSVIAGPIALKLHVRLVTQLVMYLQVTVAVLLHVRTCKARSQISRTVEPIALKFGTVIGTDWYGGVQKSVGI